MPPLLLYALIVLVLSTAAGVGFSIGGYLSGFFTLLGVVVVVVALWQPLLKPYIEKMAKK